MKRILVPCDFSKPALEAFKMAVEIAAKSNGSVTVLHIHYVPVVYDLNFIGDPVMSNPSFYSALEDAAKKAYDKMLKKQETGSVQIDFETQNGGLIECIQRTAEAKDIDLILMGTSGSMGLGEFVGSNTEKAVRFSKVPVLAIRTAPNVRLVKDILLPTTATLGQADFMERLKELQHFFKATLHILMINTPSNFMRDADGKEALKEFAKHYDLNNYQLHFIADHNEEDGIINFARTNKVDLIAMATHSRRGLAHLFKGSISEDVVNNIHTPVWTFSIRK